MGDRTNGMLKRRGLLAGAAALLGTGLARLWGAGRAEAAHDTGGTPEALHADVVNTTADTTYLRTTLFSYPVLSVINNSGSLNRQLGDAIQGFTGSGGAGVRGIAEGGTGPIYGVVGEARDAATASFGMKGVAGSEGLYPNTTAGVWGTARDTNGVIGTSTNFSGVIGIAGGAGPGLGAPFGVVGTSVAQVGVFGSSTNNFGVRGLSTNNVGVYAESVSSTATFAAGPRGVWGRTTSGIGVLAQATAGGTVQNRSYGVYAAAPAPGWAGYFEGNVYVTGSVTQAGNAPATSTAQASDGSTRALYSQDSTEPVVEDFGEGKLVGGKAEVKLDADFAAIADGGAYQVFLTEYGDVGTLFVASRTPASFEVRSRTGASGNFGYRVVAKRKGATGKRLERLERPKGLDAKDLEPPKLPEAPAGPERPTEPRPEPPRPGRQDAR